jgi:hypothetical protein
MPAHEAGEVCPLALAASHLPWARLNRRELRITRRRGGRFSSNAAIERMLATQTQLSAQVTRDRARQERRPDKPPAMYAQSVQRHKSGYPRMGNCYYARVMGVECGLIGGFFASAGASDQPPCSRWRATSSTTLGRWSRRSTSPRRLLRRARPKAQPRAQCFLRSASSMRMGRWPQFRGRYRRRPSTARMP